ncbi:MAG: biotin/lipoyl-binding protein [Alphaproteobacteria bacterium]|nr:biotin/lipoyl-binding protein [Alphaproteobacteria bacterium]MBO4643251.1 biotin/lipoyl-binding protein [Alphaproteobacteria bacterium]
MAKKVVNFMCTAFRDGFQSVFGMRVLPKDYFPAVEMARDAGIRYFEAGGGAAFQSAFFYCNENAFDVMDKFREVAGPDANLQTLARGINVVGLDSMSTDLISLHAKLFKKHGITTIRNFDALNDPNNLIVSGKAIKDAGLQHQMTITIMSLPPGCTGAHDADFYEQRLRAVLDADVPFDSMCLKDASGTCTPAIVHETIKRMRKLTDKPISFHTHETAGTSVLCCMSAIEAGADTIDLSMAPVSGGTCSPDILTMWHALRGTDYVLDVDPQKILETEEFLKNALSEYLLPPEAMKVEPRVPWSPLPGGALTANTQMLRDNGILDKFPEIVKAMEEVVRKGGYGTSVTPVSQFYFQQAFNNVMQGPWKKIAEGYGKMVLGYFGRTPHEPDPEVVKIASEQLKLEPTKESPLAINDRNPNKQLAHFCDVLKKNDLPITDENVFIAAACGDKGIAFLKGEAKIGVRYKEKAAVKATSGNFDVTVNGQSYQASLDGDKIIVNGKAFNVSVAPAGQAAKPAAGGVGTEVKSPVPGTLTKLLVKEGDAVKKGQQIAVLEVMKMESPVPSPADGVVGRISVRQGEQVVTGQLLMTLN